MDGSSTSLLAHAVHYDAAVHPKNIVLITVWIQNSTPILPSNIY